METVIVTVRHRDRQADLELPAQVPLRLLAPLLLRELAWLEPAETGELAVSAWLIEASQNIDPNDTLAAAGVVRGNTLELAVGVPAEPAARAGAPYLLSPITGERFHWQGRSALVGRPDPPRHPPDVDLSPLDRRRITSRRHAQIWHGSRSDYWVKDLRSTNGTLVDGAPLAPGGRVRLQDGSRIQFGEGGPILVFHLPAADEAT